MDRVILHCDMNAFYASVELLSFPELASRPVAVCGDPEARHGIILAKNERAKAFGVVTAETVWSARRKCPGLVLLSAHHDRYREYCRRINGIYCRFTDMVEAFSIDESWLDVTGSTRLFGGGEEIADNIRRTVKGELGLTLSVGVSFNKIFAKMGSDYRKPDATTLVSRGNFRQLIWPLPVRDMFGVGGATAAKLAGRGIKTIGGLASCDRTLLEAQLGKNGGLLHDRANGLDDSPVAAALERRRIKSVGNGTTFRRDISGEEDIRAGVVALADTVAGRLRKHGVKCRCVRVDIKDPLFRTISRQTRLAAATNVTEDIVRAAMGLMARHWRSGDPIRLITVTAEALADEGDAEQMSFLDGASLGTGAAPDGPRRGESLDRAVDSIRRRYGAGAITFGSVLNNDIGVGVETEMDEHADWPGL
ncbi:MAG: DNA polymerase IV [Clostridiales Family XIII bacterium]|jgi:DNA polymerase-4|nr:DNA polymerase IV [Clostridiales Family XIII bacterium]